jgi:Tfp pilus assembly protein PilF
MKFRKMAAAMAGMALFAASAFAQTAAIEGRVIGYDGNPLQGAVIKLVRTDVKGNYQTKTDKKGKWIYMGLPVGALFNITCEVDGKTTDTLQGVKGGLGDPSSANFDLRKSKAEQEQRQAAFQKAAESGKLTDDLTRGMSAEQKADAEKKLKERLDKMKKNKDLDDSFNAGMTAIDNKQWDAAIAALTKASEVDPTQTAIWANLAESYIGLAGTKTGADFDAAVAKGMENYNKAISMKPEDAALHNNYGRALVAAKKMPEAMAEMNKAAQLDPAGAGKYFYNLGAILTNAGQGDQAAAAFQKAIDSDPKYADAYYQLGVSLMGKAAVDTATGKVTPAPGTLEALNKYMELAPTGQFAESAKGLIESLGAKVDTSYKNPNAPAKTGTTKAPTTTKKK